jgi:hypothetical protein
MNARASENYLAISRSSSAVLFQKYVRRFGPSTKMALQPNFDGIVIGWSSSKILAVMK